uniref:Uncharacterized protein n=1 Tax=Arundo donax TaxID=35708 RepID=A0A0A9DVH1_ARUDO
MTSWKHFARVSSAPSTWDVCLHSVVHCVASGRPIFYCKVQTAFWLDFLITADMYTLVCMAEMEAAQFNCSVIFMICIAGAGGALR